MKAAWSLARGANVCDPGRPLEQRAEHLQVFLDRALAPAGRPQRVGGDEPRRAAKADLTRRGKVRMAEKAPPQEPTAVRPIEVVAKDPVPNERFDVEVDRIGAAEQLDGLLGDSQLPSGVADVHRNGSLTRRE